MSAIWSYGSISPPTPDWFASPPPTYEQRLREAGWIRWDGSCAWEPRVQVNFMDLLNAFYITPMREQLNRPGLIMDALIAEKNLLGKTPLIVPKATIRKRISRFFGKLRIPPSTKSGCFEDGEDW